VGKEGMISITKCDCNRYNMQPVFLGLILGIVFTTALFVLKVLDKLDIVIKEQKQIEKLLQIKCENYKENKK
jgi:capsular polysaccharide biosynthesis protein